MFGLRFPLLAACAALSTVAHAQTPLASPSPEASGRFGEAVSSLGDADGDGVRDVLIGAPGETASGVAGAGRAYVISGADGSVLLTLEPGSPIDGGRFGAAAASGGDLNGDGFPDPIIGAPGMSVGTAERAGRAYVFSGADGALLSSLVSPIPTPVGLFGASVSRVPDVDGDGTNEIVVGAPQERGTPDTQGPARSGGYHVFSGATGTLIESGSYPEEDARLGAVVRASDVDGDGSPEIIASVPGIDVGGVEFAGGVTIDAASPPAIVAPSPTDHPHFGTSLAVVGDRNGDDIADLFASAETIVYVLSGATGDLLLTIESPDGPGVAFGWSVSGAGNVDETGVGDLLVSAISGEVRGIPNAGRVYIFSGEDGSLIGSFTSPNAETLGQFGFSVSLAGDIDDDNTADQIVGAPGETVGGVSGAGRAYLLFSSTVVASGEAPPPDLTLTAWPNPTRGTLHVEFAAARAARVVVLDALGREVAHAPGASGEVQFETGTWAPGVYAVQIRGAARTESRRITVVR